jgi:hypothetical protein
VKKAIIVVVVIFVIYFLLTNPTGSADIVQQALDWGMDALASIASFVQSLFA